MGGPWTLGKLSLSPLISVPSCKRGDKTSGPCPGGTDENSPAFQGGDGTRAGPSPEGTAGIMYRPFGNTTRDGASRGGGRSRLEPSAADPPIPATPDLRHPA